MINIATYSLAVSQLQLSVASPRHQDFPDGFLEGIANVAAGLELPGHDLLPNHVNHLQGSFGSKIGGLSTIQQSVK